MVLSCPRPHPARVIMSVTSSLFKSAVSPAVLKFTDGEQAIQICVFACRVNSRHWYRGILLDCRLRFSADWSADKPQRHFSNRGEEHYRGGCRRPASNVEEHYHFRAIRRHLWDAHHTLL